MKKFVLSFKISWSGDPPPDMSSLDKNDLSLRPLPPLEALINCKGVTGTRLCKYGYVDIEGNRYEAKAINQSLPAGILVRVLKIEFNRLVVAPVRFHPYFNTFVYVDDLYS